MKLFIYKMLTGMKFKCLLQRLSHFFERFFPWGYAHFFVPLKMRGKQWMLGYVMDAEENAQSEQSADDRLVPLWTFHPQRVMEAEPKVSVIVPNYNHEPYLRERLEAVYHQTYKNYEVILLDDCSTDHSRDILMEYKNKYPERTKVCFNESNGCNVFKQWEKGMSMAEGRYIWIAESDDYCSADFLEKMIPAFADESVMLAFCRSDFMQDGQKTFSTELYLRDIPDFDWTKSFTVTAHTLAAKAFALKNIIPNVSSAVFRKKDDFSQELQEVWKGMALCGDWAFYLAVMKGGCVYYTPDTTNYYRVHKKSTSLKIQKEPRYYEEHERIACYIARNYLVPFSCHEQHLKSLQEHYLTFFGGKDEHDVEQWFSLERIREAAKERKPNVLMCIFSMTIGGGETFPIGLANEMKRQDESVTVLDFQMDEYKPLVRNMLRNDVPYIQLKGTNGLRCVIEQFGIDVVHSHHGSVDEAVSYVVSKEKGHPAHVITLHGMYEATPECYLKPLLEKVAKSCSAYIYIADKNLIPFREHDVKDFSSFYKIGNGLAYSTGNPVSRSEIGVPEDAFVLCLVSRAIPEKGWQAAADAVSMAREQSGRDIHLLLVGSGEMYDRMKGKVPAFVHLLGFQANVRDYFATADVGLLPSEFQGESFPLTVIDSLFCGRPVVATDLGEVRNQLQDERGEYAGVVLELENGKVPVAKLANIIAELAVSPEKYESLQQRTASASKKFFIDYVVGRYLDVYRKVM